MQYFYTLLLLVVASQSYAQNLYIKTFGDSTTTPIIYLHGGPGYNSANFEATTAEKLVQEGFFVIVYDRRGEGRSEEMIAEFTFQESIADLDNIYQTYNLENAILIGHSFGGILAILFAEKHPAKIQQVLLLSAPIVMQNVFKTIIANSEQIYQAKKDKVNLNYIAMLKKMDTHSIEYSGYCFMHATANGFYTPKAMTDDAKAIYTAYGQSKLFEYANQMSYAAPQGFWEKERYTSMDLSVTLAKLVTGKIPFYGIYGKDDGLFSEEQLNHLTQLIGEKNMLYLENCAHNPFLDQQRIFLDFFNRLKNN